MSRGQVRMDGEHAQLLAAAAILRETSCAAPPPAPGQPRVPGLGKPSVPTPQIKHVEKKDLRVELRAVRSGRCGKGNWVFFLKDLS